MVTIKQEVYEVLIEIGAMVWQNQADENATNDIETVVERAKQRPHTEITDQLWTVLRRKAIIVSYLIKKIAIKISTHFIYRVFILPRLESSV